MSWSSPTPATGYALVEAVSDSSAPTWLRQIPAVDVLSPAASDTRSAPKF